MTSKALPRRCIRIKAGLYDRLYDHMLDTGAPSISALVEQFIEERFCSNRPMGKTLSEEGEGSEEMQGYVDPITYL